MTCKKNEIKIIDDLALKNLSGAGVGLGSLYIVGVVVTWGALLSLDNKSNFSTAKLAFSKNSS